jgi:BASS family bile acid:Na+ symporter
MAGAGNIIYLLILSIWLIVLSLGARASVSDALSVIRKPSLLAPAMAAIFLVVPAFAVAVSYLFPLAPEIKLALVALAVSPVPPILPLKQLKTGAGHDYAIGLLVAAAAASLVATPLLLALAGKILGADVSIPAVRVAKTMLVSIGLPLAAGLALKAFAPRIARLVERFAPVAGALLLLFGLAFLVVNAWQTILALIGNGTLASITAMIAVGLAAGHLLAGPQPAQKGALALAAATRHPGLALAIADINFPNRLAGAQGALLLFVLVNLVVTAPYVHWMQGRAARAAAPSA